MAERTGFEPATSDVTGRRSNQLNYRSEHPPKRGGEDNSKIEPRARDSRKEKVGGRYRSRTSDPRLVKPMLYQLS